MSMKEFSPFVGGMCKSRSSSEQDYTRERDYRIRYGNDNKARVPEEGPKYSESKILENGVIDKEKL